MTKNFSPNALLSGVLTLLLALFGLSAAHADSQQDYCIKCTNPDLTYICRIVSSSTQTQGRQFLCIMNIAKEQGHDSCAATNQTQACSGVLVQYEISGSSPQQIPTIDATTTTAPAILPEAQDAKTGEAKTLVEFTKQATKATKKGLNSAGSDTKKLFTNTGKAIKKTGHKIKKFTNKVGSNIKSATKTTLKCITSLFFSCGSE